MQEPMPSLIPPPPPFVLVQQYRSQVGATAVLLTNILANCSGGGDFILELEGEGDDDDGT